MQKQQPQESESINSSEVQLPDSTAVKKPFVEPEVSVPVDVLEVTTFQAAVTSGATN